MYRRRCNGIAHTVRRGDTMYALAREYNVPLDLLLRVNPNVDIYNLKPGSRICIPKWRQEDRPMPGRPMPGRPMPGRPMPDRPVPGGIMPEVEDMSAEEISADTVSGNVESAEGYSDGYDDIIQDTGYGEDSDMGMNMIMDVGMPRGMYTDMDTEPTPASEGSDNSFAYIVRDGDSVDRILSKFSITMEQFIENNNPGNVMLKAGTTIIIPM